MPFASKYALVVVVVVAVIDALGVAATDADEADKDDKDLVDTMASLADKAVVPSRERMTDKEQKLYHNKKFDLKHLSPEMGIFAPTVDLEVERESNGLPKRAAINDPTNSSLLPAKIGAPVETADVSFDSKSVIVSELDFSHSLQTGNVVNSLMDFSRETNVSIGPTSLGFSAKIDAPFQAAYSPFWSKDVELTYSTNQNGSTNSDPIVRDLDAAFERTGMRARAAEKLMSGKSAYYSNKEIKMLFDNLAATYPDKAFAYSFGKSVDGTDLYVLAVGKSPKKQVKLRPNFRLVANLDGNIVVGREIVIRFAKFLLHNYENVTWVKTLLDSALIHMAPSLNPDGYDQAKVEDNIESTNANRVTLNTNFPEVLNSRKTQKPEPETKAIMDWTMAKRFVISCDFSAYEDNVLYPYNSRPDNAEIRYSRTPDDDVFRYLAMTYAMYKLEKPSYEIPIANGAQAMLVRGTMMDWTYARAGTFELDIGMSGDSFPKDYSRIDKIFKNHFNSMKSFLFKGFLGVKGIVTDGLTKKALSGAEVMVVGREDHKSKTNSFGEYWRLLLPGRRSLTVKYAGCRNVTREVIVPAPTSKEDVMSFARLDLEICSEKNNGSKNEVKNSASSGRWKSYRSLVVGVIGVVVSGAISGVSRSISSHDFSGVSGVFLCWENFWYGGLDYL